MFVDGLVYPQLSKHL